MKLAEALLDAGRARREPAAVLRAARRTRRRARRAVRARTDRGARRAGTTRRSGHFERAIALFPGARRGALRAGALLSRARTPGRGASARWSSTRGIGARWPALDDPVLAAVTALRGRPAARCCSAGIKLADAGDVDGAIAAHEAALARDPSLAQAHANLIALYGRAAELGQGRGALPRGARARRQRRRRCTTTTACCSGCRSSGTDAADAYRRALALNPLHAQAHNNLGQMLERSATVRRGALDEYRQALESQPTFRLARFNLGRMLHCAGTAGRGRRRAREAAEPRDAEAPRYLFALSRRTSAAGTKRRGPEVGDRGAATCALQFGQHRPRRGHRPRTGEAQMRSACDASALSSLCRGGAHCPPAQSRPVARPLRRGRGGDRPDVHARQRRHRPVLHGRADGRRRRAVRLRQRRRPRRVPGAGRPARRRRDRGCRRAPISRLFRNDLTPAPGGTRTLALHRRHRARRASALRAYGMGAAVGDYDNDGDLDLFVTAFGPDTLFRNNGDGTFTDVTAEAGVSDPLWSTSAAFLDYDRDGDLDLFVANYLDFTLARQQDLRRPGSARATTAARASTAPCPIGCTATTATAASPNVTDAAGIAKADGAGLGVVAGRLQRRRLARSLRRQRRDAEPALDQPARRHVRGRGPAVGRGVERRRQSRGQHGHRVGRLRRRRRRGSVRHQHHRRDVRALRERRQGQLRGRARPRRAGAADRGVHRVRHRLVRLRQRRLARPVRRQRRGQRRSRRSADSRARSG